MVFPVGQGHRARLVDIAEDDNHQRVEQRTEPAPLVLVKVACARRPAVDPSSVDHILLVDMMDDRDAVHDAEHVSRLLLCEGLALYLAVDIFYPQVLSDVDHNWQAGVNPINCHVLLSPIEHQWALERDHLCAVHSRGIRSVVESHGSGCKRHEDHRQHNRDADTRRKDDPRKTCCAAVVLDFLVLRDRINHQHSLEVCPHGLLVLNQLTSPEKLELVLASSPRAVELC